MHLVMGAKTVPENVGFKGHIDLFNQICWEDAPSGMSFKHADTPESPLTMCTSRDTVFFLTNDEIYVLA